VLRVFPLRVDKFLPLLLRLEFRWIRGLLQESGAERPPCIRKCTVVGRESVDQVRPEPAWAAAAGLEDGRLSARGLSDDAQSERMEGARRDPLAAKNRCQVSRDPLFELFCCTPVECEEQDLIGRRVTCFE